MKIPKPKESKILYEICNHDWGKWDKLSYDQNGIYIQERYCKKCGEGEMGKINIKNE